ncbi:MAG: hypothetical protein AABY53_09660 [Bdellovibrionota bacterium]
MLKYALYKTGGIIKSIYFLSFFIAMSGCSSSQNRTPTNHNSLSSVSCEDSLRDDPNLSALSGYPVGPQFIKYSKKPEVPLLRPFYTDGCSASPDGIIGTDQKKLWHDCCVQHDIKYWIGGNKTEKEIADSELKKCIEDKGYAPVSGFFKFFVKLFGGPDSQRSYRWGYGWNYSRPYGPLTAEERAQLNVLNEIEYVESIKYSVSQIGRICSAHDPIFKKISADEKTVYALLNSKLKRNDTIQWAKWAFSETIEKKFELKLKSCDDLVTVIFSGKHDVPLEIRTKCDL